MQRTQRKERKKHNERNKRNSRTKRELQPIGTELSCFQLKFLRFNFFQYQ